MICRKCKRELPPDALYCLYCGASQEIKRKGRTRPNGTGTAVKRGKTWTARVVVGWKHTDNGTSPIWRTKGGFKKKREALDHCSQLLNAPKTSKRMTMQQIYDAWLPIHETRVGKSTMDCYKAAYRYFAPLHYMPFQDIDADDLQECIDDCPKGKRTKENMKAIAGLLMKYALPRHQTDMNYAEFLHTGTGEKGTHPAFTQDQIERIRNQIGITPYAEYVYVLIYTGFRPTELFNLTSKDLINGVLFGGAKTRAGKGRAVPVSSKISHICAENSAQNQFWLFPRADGSQMTASYFRDYCFYPVLAAAGIQGIPSPDRPAYYVPYSCRHTFANLLKDAPGSDKDKAGLMGHEDYSTTQKHYQTATLEAFKSIIDAI